jgi:hypothetical protein
LAHEALVTVLSEDELQPLNVNPAAITATAKIPNFLFTLAPILIGAKWLMGKIIQGLSTCKYANGLQSQLFSKLNQPTAILN